MDLIVIDKTIQGMCSEITDNTQTGITWQGLNESDLNYHAIVCVFGSQLVYEMAIAAAERIKSAGLLTIPEMESRESYRSMLLDALSPPMHYKYQGHDRISGMRFKNRFTTFVSETLYMLRQNNTSIKALLSHTDSPKSARRTLVNNVKGFGPKQASLFLRRIGYSLELAVLDTHIIDYLGLKYGTDISRREIGKVAGYERMESKFQQIAEGFGFSVGQVDLAMWITMRVAKSEHISWA